MTRSDDGGTTGRHALAAHVEECDACHANPPPVDRIATLLNRSAVELDARTLSQFVILHARPALQRAAGWALWRRVAPSVLLALLPLPAVVAYDAYLLHLVYDVVSWLLPVRVAAYVVASYVASLTLLFAVTYATVPLFLAHRVGPHTPAHGA